MVVQFLSLIGLLLICSFGPGLFLVRRLRLTPGERLCASVGGSYAFLYATSFLIYVLKLPGAWFYLVSAVCLTLSLLSLPDMARLARRRSVRRRAGAFGLLFLWGFLLLALVRHYSGGFWAGDWWEHFDRTKFFLDHRPLDTKFLDLYLLPARPPLMNLVAGHFLAQTGVRYEWFQVVFLFLNLLIFFPLCQLALFLARRGRALPWLPFFLMACPMFQQNLTWTWTKLFTGFYVVLGIWFYLTGWRKGQAWRIVAAFLSLSTGALVHYSAVPYGVFLVLHYLAFVWPWRPTRWREALTAGLLSAALLATWFAWSLAEYGVRDTFASNTTAAGLEESSPGQYVSKVLNNLWLTTLPHPFHLSKAEFDKRFAQPSSRGYVRDFTFVIYQTNLLFAMGSVGGPLVIYLLVRTLWPRPDGVNDLRRFWLLLIPCCTVLGIAVHPTVETFGVAHICLQPLFLIGLTFLAVRFDTLPPVLRWLGLAGTVVDFLLGVYLHFSLENQVFQVHVVRQKLQVTPTPDLLSFRAFRNFAAKLQLEASFLGDFFVPLARLIQVLLIVAFGALLVRRLQRGRFLNSVPEKTPRDSTIVNPGGKN